MPRYCRFVIVGLFFSLLFTLTACSTTPQDIDVWADSVGGDAKIADTIADPGADMAVRSYAMVKLIRLRDFARLQGTLEKLDKVERIALIRAGANDIGKLLIFPDLNVQAAAKDALYIFLKLENKQVAQSARQALLMWYGTDFLKKYAAGKFSAFHVLTQLGDAAGDVIVNVMKSDPQAWVKAAKIAESIDSPKINAQLDKLYLSRFKPDDDPKLAKEILEVACYARGQAFSAFIAQYVQNKDNPYALRRKAMNTLTFHPNRESVPAVLAIAKDEKETGDMRGLALEVFEKVGKPEEAAELVPFINDDNIRWFAFKAAVKVGGPSLVTAMLEKLKPNTKLWREDYDFAAKAAVESGKGAAQAIQPFLKSGDAATIVIALLAIERLKATGAKPDVDKLTGDKRLVPRYSGDKKVTVGEIASQVSKNLAS